MGTAVNIMGYPPLSRALMGWNLPNGGFLKKGLARVIIHLGIFHDKPSSELGVAPFTEVTTLRHDLQGQSRRPIWPAWGGFMKLCFEEELSHRSSTNRTNRCIWHVFSRFWKARFYWFLIIKFYHVYVINRFDDKQSKIIIQSVMVSIIRWTHSLLVQPCVLFVEIDGRIWLVV